MSSKEESVPVQMPSSTLPKGCKFTAEEKDPQRVSRVELELVNFTLNLTTEDGTHITISDAVHVQSILNEARDFNRFILGLGQGHSSNGDGSDDNIEDACTNTASKEINDDGGKNADAGGSESSRRGFNMALHIEIKLDPLNSVNTYRIQV